MHCTPVMFSALSIRCGDMKCSLLRVTVRSAHVNSRTAKEGDHALDGLQLHPLPARQPQRARGSNVADARGSLRDADERERVGLF